VNDIAPHTESHVDRIYQAAVSPEYWPSFLETLREELGATSLHLGFRLPSPGDPGVMLTVGLQEGFENAYRSYFHSVDPWMPRIAGEREGVIRALEEFVPESELVGTEFYNDWLRPQGILHGFGAFLYKSGPGELVSSLSGFRDKHSGPFQKEDLDRIKPLVSHLQRALEIHRRIGTAQLRADAAEEALDRISGGVILLDDRLDLVATNRAGDEILSMNDGLALDRDGPSAVMQKQTRELRKLLSRAAAAGARAGSNAGGVMSLARPSGRPALQIVVIPVRRESSPLFDRRATAAVFVTDPAAGVERPPERLRRIYGLTVTEAEVASRLARGMRLPEIGEDLGVSLHTIRGHLKQLFAKTGTHRQADLIRVLLTGPARFRLE